MKLTPYKQVLKFSKEKIKESLAPIRAMQTKKQGELEIAKLDEKIATAESNIQEICSEHPLDYHKLIEAQDELALMERRKKQLARIIKELFEDEQED